MKTNLLAVLLLFSLAANAALYFQRRPSAPTSAPRTAAATPAGSAPGAAPTAEAVVSPQAEAAQFAKTWASLQSGDPKVLAERLRAAGFSAAMIRAIVAAQVSEQFSARRKALLAQQEDLPFWKSQQRFGLDPKTMSALRELGREQSNRLKELLGPDGAPGSEEMQAYQRRQFGDIPREKMEQMQNILSDYNDLRNQVYTASNGVFLPEDREKLALLEREQRADLAAVLTPEEFENYELRSSSTANTLRGQLALFNPTEEEFRAIFKLQQAFDEKYGSSNGMISSAEQFRQRQAHQAELLTQVQGVLNPDRVDAYKQATDPAYQMVNRLVARLELPASAATQVVAVQQDIMKRAGAVRTNQSLSPDERNIQLTALAQEATTQLTTVLGGTRGLEAYKQYGGQWVTSLVPRPPTPPRG